MPDKTRYEEGFSHRKKPQGTIWKFGKVKVISAHYTATTPVIYVSLSLELGTTPY
jgi:hypothetical protein